MAADNFIELNKILDKDDTLDEEMMSKAAYELLSRQFLFRQKNHQKRHFQLINLHQTYYRRLMKATGHNLVVDENYGYVGIIPFDFSRKMPLEQTLILLALRNVYDEEMQNFNAGTDGSVKLLVEEFMLKYETMTGRERPQNKSDLLSLLTPMVRFGVIKEYRDIEHNDEWILCIYPSITALVNGDSLNLIEAHMRARDIDTHNIDNRDEETAQ